MAKPFLKWAGGKTQLMNDIESIIGDIRTGMESFVYVEPFLGGGSVLLYLLDTCSNLKYAIVNDINTELINCYKVVADDVLYYELKEKLYEIQKDYNESNDKKSFYDNIRKSYNEWMLSKKDDSLCVVGAVNFIFLNKCGFNGLYRVSKKSGYNVPWSQKGYLNIVDFDNLDRVHILLKDKVIFLNCDYKNISFISELKRVDKQNVLFYFDPPYKPLSSTSSFVNYSVGGFDDKSQVELRDICVDIDKNGGYFVLSNSSVGDFFDVLYKDFNIQKVKAKRNINSDASKRGYVDEVLITNFNISEENEKYRLF
jgi:DNA adenine methylase